MNWITRLLERPRRPVELEPREAYRLWAENYPPRAHNVLMQVEQTALLSLLPDVRDKWAVDLACGTGRYALLLKERGARVLGLDLSFEMLIRADGNLPRTQSDLTHVPLRDGSVDIIVCGLAIGHVEDLSLALREIARVLAPGGLALYSDFHPMGRELGWQRTFRTVAGDQYAVQFVVHDLATHQRAADAAGLSLEIVEVGVSQELASVNEDAAWYRSRWGDTPVAVVVRAQNMIIWAPAIFFDNALLLDAEDGASLTSLRLAHGRVAGRGVKAHSSDRRVDLAGAIVLPGLINAHDHLHMNHFPHLKYRPVYAHAHDWSLDIEFRLDTDPAILAGRSVPLPDRLFIGGLKNLLAGVTTVCHHDPMHAPLRRRYPVRVVRRCGWCHSLQRGGDVARSYRQTPRDWPWIIHLAEGTNDVAAQELNRLDALGCVRANTIVVHGVGLTAADRARLIERAGGLIWCPSSNAFLLGVTAQVAEVARARRLAVGSDSRLTGARDLLDELACARTAGQISQIELLRAVTVDAAQLLRLKDVGRLAVGSRADLLILPPGDPWEALGTVPRADVRAVLIDGEVRVADPDFKALLPDGQRCSVDKRDKLMARDLIDRYRRCSIREAELDVDRETGEVVPRLRRKASSNGMKCEIGESRSFSPWPSHRAPKRILIIRLQAIGDVMITIPACCALRKRFPEAQICFMTSESCSQIPSAIRTFDHVHTLPQSQSRWLRSAQTLAAGIRMYRNRYDLIVDLQRHRRSRIIRRLARPKAWSEFDRFSPKPALERTLDTFQRAGLPDLMPIFKLDLKREVLDRSYSILRDNGWDGKEKLIILNPAGLWATRQWPLQRYEELAELWQGIEPVRFLLLGTDRLFEKARHLAGSLGRRLIVLVNRTSLAEAIGIEQYAALMISEDSGLLHMAWVSGIPTVAIFGSSRSDWTRPMGQHSRFLGSEDLPCGACMEAACRFGDVHCLSRHSAETILRLAQEAEKGE